MQLCGGGKYWRIGLSTRIGGEIFGDFGFKSKGTKLVSKYWYIGKILANGSRFTKFANIFPRCIIALYCMCRCFWQTFQLDHVLSHLYVLCINKIIGTR